MWIQCHDCTCVSDCVHVYLAFAAQSHCHVLWNCNFILHWLLIWYWDPNTHLQCMFKPTFNQLVTNASKFQSDMSYSLKRWYFWFLFISFTIELYCRYTHVLVWVKTPDLGSLFLTFNNLLCVLLQLLLFEGHTGLSNKSLYKLMGPWCRSSYS